MKYTVLMPLVREQPYYVGDPIEIENKAEAERMVAAGIVMPIADARKIRVETADLQPVGVEKTVKVVKSGSGKKR